MVKDLDRAVRRRTARRRVGEGQAGAHPRPRGARRRVGLGPAAGLAVQHPPRRPRPGTARRVRDAGQDVQGHDRRDAGLADRAVPRAGDAPRRLRSCTCGPSRSSRSPSTACSAPPATPAAWRCASPGWCATATTRTPPRPTPSTTVRALRPGAVDPGLGSPGRSALMSRGTPAQGARSPLRRRPQPGPSEAGTPARRVAAPVGPPARRVVDAPAESAESHAEPVDEPQRAPQRWAGAPAPAGAATARRATATPERTASTMGDLPRLLPDRDRHHRLPRARRVLYHRARPHYRPHDDPPPLASSTTPTGSCCSTTTSARGRHPGVSIG